MASNPISKALQDLARRVLPLIKGYLQQEAPVQLEAFYDEYLQTQSKPDRRAKSGRLYYSRPNTSDKLRLQYGNIFRATRTRGKGNIYELFIEGNNVVMVSGIDTDQQVKAGPDTVSLKYAEFHEQGTSRYKARPFLGPGFKDFNRKELPILLDRFADELAEIYGS